MGPFLPGSGLFHVGLVETYPELIEAVDCFRWGSQFLFDPRIKDLASDSASPAHYSRPH
jgi:hypothetical protein